MGNITNFGRIVAKRVKEGLYAGRNIGYGNNVSEDGGNKTRRHWKPNSHRKRLYSEVLDRLVSVNVTAHALRCIDKAGGLDAYLLNTRPKDLMSNKAMEIRREIAAAITTGAGPGHVVGMPPRAVQRAAAMAEKAAAVKGGQS
mgnify:FL=1|jgi:large subunit ribosomal protein L28